MTAKTQKSNGIMHYHLLFKFFENYFMTMILRRLVLQDKTSAKSLLTNCMEPILPTNTPEDTDSGFFHVHKDTTLLYNDTSFSRVRRPIWIHTV